MKTTNYELSKKLKEIGFKADYDFIWAKEFCDEGEACLSCHSGYDIEEYYECIQAYNLETILEALPNFIENRPLVLDVAFGEIHYEGDSENDALFITTTKENESLADTAARLLITIHEKGIIKFKN